MSITKYLSVAPGAIVVQTEGGLVCGVSRMEPNGERLMLDNYVVLDWDDYDEGVEYARWLAAELGLAEAR